MSQVLQTRVTMLKDRMLAAKDALARNLAPPPGQAPDFHVKLTEEEQLQQWAAMDQPKWEALIKQQGLADVLDYSEAMQKLADKHYPGWSASWGTMQAGTYPDLQNPDIPDVVRSAQARVGMMNPQLQQQPVSADQMMGQALASAGMTPERIQAMMNPQGTPNG